MWPNERTRSSYRLRVPQVSRAAHCLAATGTGAANSEQSYGDSYAKANRRVRTIKKC